MKNNFLLNEYSTKMKNLFKVLCKGVQKIAPRSGLGFGLGLVLELGSVAIFLEPCVRTCTSTCTSICTIFAVADFTKCNGPLKVHQCRFENLPI